MSIQNIANLTPEGAREIPMVDLAFAVLKQANNPMYYRDLMKEIARIKGLTDDEVNEVIAHVYTEINIDGRFACVGNNLWGLKRWYPVERSEDAVGIHPRIINDDDDDDLDDQALFEDEAEDTAEAEEGFDGDEDDEEEEADEELFDEDDEELVDEDLEEESELDEELDEDARDDAEDQEDE